MACLDFEDPTQIGLAFLGTGILKDQVSLNILCLISDFYQNKW